MALSEAQINVIVVSVLVVSIAIALAVFFGYLAYVNKYGKVKRERPPRSKPVRIIIFIVRNVLLEVVGLVMLVFQIIGFYPTDKWLPLIMDPIIIAFYFFQALKYTLLIFNIICEYKFEHVPEKVAKKLHIRPDWPEVLDNLIFIPMLIIDGMLTVAEAEQGPSGTFFDYDGLILLFVDNLLFIKTMIIAILDLWTSHGYYKYPLLDIFYSIMSLLYTLFSVYFYIIIHLNSITTSGMNVTVTMALILANICIHPLLMSYTSMMRQGIVALDKALQSEEMKGAREKQRDAWLTYFSPKIWWRILNLCFYIFMFYVYCFTYIVASHLLVSRRMDKPFFEVMTLLVIAIILVLTVFYLMNLVYGTIKRFGAMMGVGSQYCRCRFAKYFNCTTYGEALSKVGMLVDLNERQRIRCGPGMCANMGCSSAECKGCFRRGGGGGGGGGCRKCNCPKRRSGGGGGRTGVAPTYTIAPQSPTSPRASVNNV